MILTLLYPDVKVGEREFHQDHLHPASALKKMKQFKERKIKRILLIATGALMNSTSSQQGESIPGIAHAVSIEL